MPESALSTRLLASLIPLTALAPATVDGPLPVAWIVEYLAD